MNGYGLLDYMKDGCKKRKKERKIGRREEIRD
jgi:hypothetical protein